MVSGATSLSLVRDELFATMEEAESSLEHFIADRHNGNLLQQAVEQLKQVRGTLNLIELAGAELLAQEVLDQATDIPAGAGDERDVQLSALSNALHVLRRYLESLDVNRQEIPELLLPAINDLRLAGTQTALPESFFFNVRLDPSRTQSAATPTMQAPLHTPLLDAEARRLRQMYQIGLLGFIREQNGPASLKLMLRALSRLDRLFAQDERSRLCWIGAAALEAQVDGQLLPRKTRKLLFSRIDRELKQMFGNLDYQAPRSLLKELLYLVALADSQGPLAGPISALFGLTALPFTDHLLEEQYQRLSGPGRAVMRSLSSAIRDELTNVKDRLDLLERGSLQTDSLSTLHELLGKLSKTLGMVGLSSASHALGAQLQQVASWDAATPIEPEALNSLAETILYVESMVATLEHDAPINLAQTLSDEPAPQSFANHQLNEARIVVIDEARGGLALSRRAINAYLDSNGDRLHLANVPFCLLAVRGGLWFLDQQRAALLVGACAEYIQKQMLEAPQIPSEQRMETLADALTCLEFYLEAGAVLRPETQPNVLDLAADSMRALGLPVAA
jgi:hypothetical protein